MPRNGVKVRNSRTHNIVTNRVYEQVADEVKSAEVKVYVEEIAADLKPLPDDEQLLDAINTYVAIDDREHGGKRIRTSQINLPPEISSLPEGEYKKEAIKAAAQAELLFGTPASAVAARYGLSIPATVNWQNTLMTFTSIGRRDRLSDLLLTFIEQEFKSLVAISIVTSDDKWVRRQSASDLAQYIAVKSDRLLVLLQAFGKVEETRKQYVDQLEVLTQDA